MWQPQSRQSQSQSQSHPFRDRQFPAIIGGEQQDQGPRPANRSRSKRSNQASKPKVKHKQTPPPWLDIVRQDDCHWHWHWDCHRTTIGTSISAATSMPIAYIFIHKSSTPAASIVRAVSGAHQSVSVVDGEPRGQCGVQGCQVQVEIKALLHIRVLFDRRALPRRSKLAPAH